MNILYDREHESRDIYTYKINQGGDLGLYYDGDSLVITIEFRNRKFYSATNPNWSAFSKGRSYWHVSAAIATEIARLESVYQEPRKEIV